MSELFYFIKEEFMSFLITLLLGIGIGFMVFYNPLSRYEFESKTPPNNPDLRIDCRSGYCDTTYIYKNSRF